MSDNATTTAVAKVEPGAMPEKVMETLERVSAAAIMMRPDLMALVKSTAAILASAEIMVPVHLHGKVGDCCAIVMQAMQWGMNPFAVAQNTHVVNGKLGYEAKLVNAVIMESGFIVGRFFYEYRGEGNGLECRVGAIIRGEREICWGEWLRSGDVTTKNSPLWKTNPKQQMGYLQVKNWTRAFCPGALLGVYTRDELEDIEMVKGPNGEYYANIEPTNPTASAPVATLPASIPSAAPVQEAAKPQAAAPAGPIVRFPGCINDNQVKALVGETRKAKITADAFKSGIRVFFGIEDIYKIPTDKYLDILAWTAGGCKEPPPKQAPVEEHKYGKDDLPTESPFDNMGEIVN